jgi:tetratricopeptide (TPR) repeat protein
MISYLKKYVCAIKRTAVLFAILFFWLLTYGQFPHIDSMRNKLQSATDTMRPFLLNSIAEEISRSFSSFPPAQKGSLLHVAKNDAMQAEALSRKLNYNSGIGTALLLSGSIKVGLSLHNYDSALLDYTKALPYLKLSGNVPYLARCYDYIAKACHWGGKLDSSIVYYDSAIYSFSQIKDTLALISCMMWQAHDYFDKGDYKNAYLLSTKALTATQKTGDTSFLIDANADLMNLFLAEEGKGAEFMVQIPAV